ncbi:DUF4132 domain-containing protein [Streptosporangium sp. NPDC002544]|uniref:DUF4132 domain-containing protein n=1 Tax=Streptosporangium sp. NPDC002544 TaxID=3154538 RepID=UPI003331AD8F
MTFAGNWDHLEPATKEAYRRFDALTEQGLDPGPGTDWRLYGTYAHTKLWLGPQGGHDYDERVLCLVRTVAGRAVDWTPDDAWNLAERASYWARQGHTRHEELYRIPLSAAHLLHPQQRRDLFGHLTDLGELQPLLESLLTEEGPAGAVRNVIGEADPFATMLAEEYGPRLAGMLPLLRHWATADTPAPGDGWLPVVCDLLTPEAIALVHELVTRLAAYRGGPFVCHHADISWSEDRFLKGRTVSMARGLIWTCEVIDEPWVPSLLADAAVTCGTGHDGPSSTCRSETVADGAVGVLARRGGPETVTPLALIQTRVRAASVQENVTRALDALADAAALTRDQFLDRTLPAADATPREVEQARTAARYRLEQALIHQREWTWREVGEHLLDHPVTGPDARTLVWRIPGGPSGLPVRTVDGWELAGHRPEGPVALWHPADASAEEVGAWRERGLAQPFEQVLREVYAEEPDRVAGHVVRYDLARTELIRHGWTGVSIGYWEHDCHEGQGEVVRDLADWQARWLLRVVEGMSDEGWDLDALCATNPMTFHRDGQEVPAASVPPLVRSEILREADLTVAAASAGPDAQHLVDHYDGYWH